MGTKKTTDTTNKYDPSSMGLFQGLNPQLTANAKNDLELDPTKAATFNMFMNKSIQNNAALGQRAKSNLFANNRALGGNENSPFLQSQLARLGRQGSTMDANAFTDAFMQHDAMRRNAAAQWMNYKPLQTGQKTTEQTSGLGTWLPQVIGAGAQIGLGFATGGMSGLAKAGAGAAGGIMGSGTALQNGSYFGSGAGQTNAQFGNWTSQNMFNPNTYSGLNGYWGGK